MKVYVKTFINPLLAIAFKEGVDFVGDPDYKAMDPKKEGDEWEVLVEHDGDDDVSDDNEIQSSPIPIRQSVILEKPEKMNLKDWMEHQSKRISKMEPLDAKTAPLNDNDKLTQRMLEIASGHPVAEIINLPVKIDEVVDEIEPLPPAPISFDSSMIEPCGECLNCAAGGERDCIKIINAACAVPVRSSEMRWPERK